ncbi:uncharacterized protein ATNIH1004_002067 [Aspergillus tanneri]|uniref:Uncharacterized protein n=1 Tax=Aspergillus tanneri TaxID=1220188 RepID=A0A5M9M6R6_9EURO|nr:uncharacterized protein ATNIH1004_002067 [Aspergillus tanneri]KAA8641266.1 hypothetical protein ATNIH1004_002067 [Aspergillus tanneri]
MGAYGRPVADSNQTIIAMVSPFPRAHRMQSLSPWRGKVWQNQLLPHRFQKQQSLQQSGVIEGRDALQRDNDTVTDAAATASTIHSAQAVGRA